MAQKTCCPQCGSRAFQFSEKGIICDICGERLDALDNVKYAQAMAHLKAGNYETSESLLWQLAAECPLEKKLYYAAFRAGTRDFSDYDSRGKGSAALAWDKIVHFYGVSPEMRQYAQNVYEYRHAELTEERSPILTLLFLCGALFLVAGILFLARRWFWGGWGIVCAIYLLGQIQNEVPNPRAIAKKFHALRKPEDNDNPFRLMEESFKQ